MARKRRSDRTGVWLRVNRHGNLYAQWVDPDSGQPVRMALSKLVRAGKIDKPTKAAAAQWVKDKQQELAERNRKGRKKLTGLKAAWTDVEAAYLAAFAAEYESADDGKVASDRVKRDYLRHWRDFIQLQDVRTTGDLTEEHIEAFRSGLKGKPATRNRIMGSVGAFLRWARKKKHLRITNDDLAEGLRPFKVPTRTPATLKPSERKRLVTALVEHDLGVVEYKREGRFNGKTTTAENNRESLAPFVLIALLTGARPGEVLSLRWDAVDLESGFITVWGSKTGRERIIPLHDSPALRSILTALQLRKGSNVYVCGDWTDKEGNPIPTDVHHRQWKRLAKLAGIEGTSPKIMRATFVSALASGSTYSEYVICARAGHGLRTSVSSYRQAQHDVSGSTVEEWLGVTDELDASMAALGLKVEAKSAKVG